jgi:nitrite reductase/ring-hydroxylating ferredoxin subunit/uncharacterized membrane protein
MISRYLDHAIKQVPALEESGVNLARTIHEAILSGGEPARRVADFLHGSWLGHPLHPVLTDIPIGAWSMASLMDGIAALTGSESARKASDWLVITGVISAVPTSIAGMTDFSTIPKKAAGAGLLHAMLNSIALTLYLVSIKARAAGSRPVGVLFSSVALLFVLTSAWLGGHLSYKLRVGVNHAAEPEKPRDWKSVMAERDLPEKTPRRIEVADTAVLLYRMGNQVHAIGAVCSHAGGPLDEGSFDGHCVECPWHQSVFDLRDGSIVHGPSAYAQPNYEARIRDGQIELRLEKQG